MTVCISLGTHLDKVKMNQYKQPSINLSKCRNLGGVNCKTAKDIVFGLGLLKSKSDQMFINSLHRAIYEGDIDIICGHIDWFRDRAGLPCLNELERDEVEVFYKDYLSKHPPDGVLRMAQFISAALEHFS
mgnify:FL=1